jgi:iron complex outermembrane receptor protein
MKLTGTLIGLLALSCLAGSVFGAEPHRVDAIVVEADEEAQALQERKESNYGKTLVTRQEMQEFGGQTAADVLRRLPRLYFSGPPTTNKDIRQAGLDKEFQNVLINGHRPPGGGEKREFALDRIPVEQIERIEILKNPTAAYDADAVAGLVNIILKETPKQQIFNAFVGGNYNDAAAQAGAKLTLEYGNQTGPLGYRLGGTRNDETRGKAKVILDLDKNQRETEEEKVRTLNSSANLGLALQAGEHDRIVFKPFVSEQSERKSKEKTTANLVTGIVNNANDEHEVKDSLLQSYTLEWEHLFASGATLKLQGLLSQNDEDKDKETDQFKLKGGLLSYDKTAFEKERKEDREKGVAADIKLPWAGPLESEHILSAGFKLRDKDREVQKTKYEINAADVFKETTIPDDSYTVDETITAFYLMDEAGLTEKLVLTPGMRVELTDGEYVTGAGVKESDHSVDWNPSLHALYKLGNGYQLRGSLARTISRPAFKDKVPTRSVKADKVEEGNPDLEAATSMNYEASIEKYIGKTGLIALGGFLKKIDDVIEKQDDGIDGDTGLPLVRPVNAGQATVKGAEIEARTGLALLGLPQVTAIANYTRLDSEVEDVNTGKKRPLADQPEDLANFTLRYAGKPLGLAASLGVSYIGEKVNASDPTKPKKIEDPFVQWDASLSKELFGGLNLQLSAINLFDEHKEKKEGGKRETEEVGRTFYAGLHYEF